MAIFDNIATERQRVMERLARIDVERARLAEQLGELEAAERVFSRFDASKAAAPQRRLRKDTEDSAGSAAPSRGRRAGSPTAAVPASPTRMRRQRPGRRRSAAKSKLPLADATLRAVEALGNDVSAERVRAYLAEELGMQVRPNHLGMALQRHRRAGRLEQRDGGWSVSGHQTAESVAVN
jgi:hypothetical protein